MKKTGTRKAVRWKRTETALGLFALATALFLNYRAGLRVDHLGAGSPSLPHDLLLNLLPRVDLTLLYLWGMGATIVLLAAAALSRERERCAYLLWIFSVLIAVRAVFLVLTPMGAPVGDFPFHSDPLFRSVGRFLTFDYDLFFSGHVALPFMGSLVYRDRPVRLAFLGIALLMAATVLLCRHHYSIDVVGAFFITYAVYTAHRDLVEPLYANLISSQRARSTIEEADPARRPTETEETS